MCRAVNFDKLFGERQGWYSLHDQYFNSFVENLLSKKSDDQMNIDYYIVFSNFSLDINEYKILKTGGSRNYYPFEFCEMNVEENSIINDILSVGK